MAKFVKGQAKIAGRTKGTPNKASADIKALAGKHGPEAVAVAVEIMRQSESDQARMMAAREIMDRAYGKATQPLAGDDTMPAIRAALTVAFRGTGSS